MKKIKMFVPFMLIFMLCLTACVKPAPESSVIEPEIHSISGTNWILTDDNSYIMFNSDETFIWALHEEILDDNYCSGTYIFYTGEEAITYVTTELGEYGLAESEIYELISKKDEYTTDNFICILLINTSFVLDGEEQFGTQYDISSTTAPYYGFIVDDDTTLLLIDSITGYGGVFSRQQ